MRTEVVQKIDKVAELLLQSDALLFTSGAGMSANSGLSTFQGKAAAIWPPLLQEPKMNYMDIVTPDWFSKPEGNNAKRDTVNFAYAFWINRYNEYKSTVPHQGYSITKQWSELNHIKLAHSFTSNIDGHWIKASWNESSVFECHGSIHYMQCMYNCRDRAWPTNNHLQLQVDSKTNCVVDPLPKCSDCNQYARPNVLMFNDWHFAGQIYNQQFVRYNQFKANLLEAKARLLIIEIGAGPTVPSVRSESERILTDNQLTVHLVRINPTVEHSKINESIRNKSKGQSIEIAMDALKALTLIDQAIKKKLKK